MSQQLQTEFKSNLSDCGVEITLIPDTHAKSRAAYQDIAGCIPAVFTSVAGSIQRGTFVLYRWCTKPFLFDCSPLWSVNGSNCCIHLFYCNSVQIYWMPTKMAVSLTSFEMSGEIVYCVVSNRFAYFFLIKQQKLQP